MELNWTELKINWGEQALNVEFSLIYFSGNGKKCISSSKTQYQPEKCWDSNTSYLLLQNWEDYRVFRRKDDGEAYIIHLIGYIYIYTIMGEVT